MLIAAIVSVLLFSSLFAQPATDPLPFNEFRTMLESGEIAQAEVDNTTGRIKGVLKDEAATEFVTDGPIERSQSDDELLRDNVKDLSFVTPTSNFFLELLPLLLFFAMIVGFFLFMQRRAQGQMSGIMSIGRSKAKTYSTERPGTTFEDVAGYDGVKQEITEVVDFLKHPDKFSEIGARIPKGILLVGPPGTGKTLIARAVAGEAGVPFLSVTGSDFMEMFVGVGASRVRDLFQSARKMGRAIIFIDEIDSIGRKRGAGLGGGHDEREQTLNQMLAEMDGFEPTEGIVMMAATNRPDILDPALLRPGRFDRQVVVPLPELDDRKQILAVHVKGKQMDPDVDLDVVARGAPGMSGADLANLVNEAALFAVRGGESVVAMRHFEMARDRVLMGQTRESMVLSTEEKERIAYHEGGHALIAALLPNSDPLHKVSIIPRGMALGVTMTLPEQERYLVRKSYIEDELVKLLGGRTAEHLVFHEVSSGASDDLARATEMARRMVSEWGMSERIGPMAWRSDGGQVFLGGGPAPAPDYSDEMATVIDEEVEKILRHADQRCHATITEHRNALDLIARSLLEHETIDGSEVMRLVGLAPAPSADTPPPLPPSPADTTGSALR